MIELWESSRIIAELQIPTKLHGGIFADGWFSSGAAWDPSESRVAYVAEVSVALPTADGQTNALAVDHTSKEYRSSDDDICSISLKPCFYPFVLSGLHALSRLYPLQVPPDAETPEWVSLATSEPSQESGEEGKSENSPNAAPKTWRGVGEFEVWPIDLLLIHS